LPRFLGENPLLDPGTRHESQVFLWIADVRVLPPCGYQPTSRHELPIDDLLALSIDNRQSTIDNAPLF